MSELKLKILVTGSINDNNLNNFFIKLTNLQLKHSFNSCLVLNLFNKIDNHSTKDLFDLLNNKFNIPLQLYITQSQNIPQIIKDRLKISNQICNNLTLLDKTGIITLASGLKIATFTADPSVPISSNDDSTNTHDESSADLNAYLQLVQPTPSTTSIPTPIISPPDILLLHSFPPSITNLSNKPLPTSSVPLAVSATLDQVMQQNRPKYVFTSNPNAFWEREPFTWPREEGGGVCRFFSLGEMGNKDKERWSYAFSVTPSTAITTIPANSTASPFTLSAKAVDAKGKGKKRSAGAIDDGVNEYGVPNYIFGAQSGAGKRGRLNERGGERSGGPPPDHYTCKICDKKGHWIQECPEKVERDRTKMNERGDVKRPIQPDECWFCLSNPKLTKHLIASIGTETYLTLPKGQLLPTSAETHGGSGSVPGGGHVLIIPIAHYPTLLSVPRGQAIPIIAEIEKYKSALRDCYASFGASMISFEVGRLSGKGGHAHIQICPIPSELADQAEACFRTEGQKTGIDYEEDSATALQAISGITDNYFRVDLPDGKTLVHLIKPGHPFNLQFGRATLATLLGIPERTEWKSCTKSDAEEKGDAIRFKEAFKTFDPSL